MSEQAHNTYVRVSIVHRRGGAGECLYALQIAQLPQQMIMSPRSSCYSTKTSGIKVQRRYGWVPMASVSCLEGSLTELLFLLMYVLVICGVQNTNDTRIKNNCE